MSHDTGSRTASAYVSILPSTGDVSGINSADQVARIVGATVPILRPCQYWSDPIRPHSPELKLCLAVLDMALSDYTKYSLAKSAKKRLLFQEARDWIFKDDFKYCYSFVNICAYLDMDPEYVRRRLKGHEGPPKKGRAHREYVITNVTSRLKGKAHG